MMKAATSLILAMILLISGCGGGGSSSNRQPSAAEPPPAVGTITVTLGDNPLENIESVFIQVRDVILLGGDDGQISIIDEPLGEIDLLKLRNITELVASDEIPADEYSKIRLLIDRLEVLEKGATDPLDRETVQLPANGKIDLNPQGTFEIGAGESLVVQIDIDLARSIKLVQTGNSEYRFRPVVFIEVLDQEFRLTKLFGELNEDDDASEEASGEVSDYDLCVVDQDTCVDVNLAADAVLRDSAGALIEPADFVLPADAHAFGHFVINDEGKVLFIAELIAFGDEDSVVSIDGDVLTEVGGDPAGFDLAEDDVTTTKVLTEGALLFDDLGNPLTAEITPGQEAEAWAQTFSLDMAVEGTFPAILVQVDEDEVEEESVEGQLVDLQDNTLTVRDELGDDQCVTITSDTEIQLISDYDNDAETDSISRTALGDLISAGVEVDAFGAQVGDCLAADLIAAEVD